MARTITTYTVHVRSHVPVTFKCPHCTHDAVFTLPVTGFASSGVNAPDLPNRAIANLNSNIASAEQGINVNRDYKTHVPLLFCDQCKKLHPLCTAAPSVGIWEGAKPTVIACVVAIALLFIPILVANLLALDSGIAFIIGIGLAALGFFVVRWVLGKLPKKQYQEKMNQYNQAVAGTRPEDLPFFHKDKQTPPESFTP